MPKLRRLIWLPEAVEDLERLRVFLRSRSPNAARRVARRILEAVKILETYPEAGKPVEDPPGFRDLFIPFGAGGYVLRYRIQEGGDVVVIRVWHSREDRPHE
ncbi:MAG: type II toxin-antitoxin system RelE/ParE family toxin [Candidatus Binataceae bacterium]